jgi:hypothetical protein
MGGSSSDDMYHIMDSEKTSRVSKMILVMLGIWR